RVLLLLALGPGHYDGALVAERLGDHSQADAGVARGALDDPPAGLQEPLPLGVADDVERGPVLDRLAGVHELGLAEDFASGRFAGVAQTDERSVPDGVEHAGANGHASYLIGAAAGR